MALAEVFVGMVGGQGVDSDLELLPIAGCVGLVWLSPIDFRKLQAVHKRDNAVIGGDEVFPGKVPICRMLKGIFLDGPRDTGHLP